MAKQLIKYMVTWSHAGAPMIRNKVVSVLEGDDVEKAVWKAIRADAKAAGLSTGKEAFNYSYIQFYPPVVQPLGRPDNKLEESENVEAKMINKAKKQDNKE